VFAPHSFDEYNRVLQEGGTWVTVTPGPSHLVEMRPKRDEKILEREQRRAEPPAEANDAVRVQFTLELSDEAALDLYTMTPLQFQASSAEAVSHVREVSVDVWVSRSALTSHPK
jgi:23S rRNA (guanine745-N1)-methyltransferase